MEGASSLFGGRWSETLVVDEGGVGDQVTKGHWLARRDVRDRRGNWITGKVPVKAQRETCPGGDQVGISGPSEVLGQCGRWDRSGDSESFWIGGRGVRVLEGFDHWAKEIHVRKRNMATLEFTRVCPVDD